MAQRIDLHNQGDVQGFARRLKRLEEMAEELTKNGYTVLPPVWQRGTK